MKRISFFIVFAYLGTNILLTGCKEKGPNVDFTVPASNKVVLIEEFTGVRCATCPKGRDQLEQLLTQYGNKLIVISIHSGFFSIPYNPPLSDDTFQVQESKDLATFLGPVQSYPAATIDRRVFDGETEKLVSSNKWAGYVNTSLQTSAPVNITVANNYSDTTRKLEVSVTLQYLQDISDENRLSVAITEDSIVDAQADDRLPSGLDTFYVHEHVLRGMLTPYNGEVIAEEKKTGTLIKKTFSFNALPSRWRPEHCKVVVYVHRAGSKMDVLQAAAAAVK